MYASRSRCASPPRSTLATTGVPFSNSARYTSPMHPPPSGRALRRRSPNAASTPSAMSLSATDLRVPFPDVPQQTLRGRLHEIQDVLEAACAAVVGVGDLGFRAGGEVEEGTHDGAAAAQGGDHGVVLLVHGEDVIEGIAVLACDTACPLSGYIDATSLRALLRPLVRGCPRKVSARSSRVNEDFALQPFP